MKILLLTILQKYHQNAKVQIPLLIWCIYEWQNTKVKGVAPSASHSVSLITNTYFIKQYSFTRWWFIFWVIAMELQF